MCDFHSKSKNNLNTIIVLLLFVKTEFKFYSAVLQTLTTSKHSVKFTYSDFPYNLKANGDKLGLINHGRKCIKKG